MLPTYTLFNIYIYIYIYICVCVYILRERESARERNRERCKNVFLFSVVGSKREQSKYFKMNRSTKRFVFFKRINISLKNANLLMDLLIWKYILSSTDRLFRSIRTLQCG